MRQIRQTNIKSCQISLCSWKSCTFTNHSQSIVEIFNPQSPSQILSPAKPFEPVSSSHSSYLWFSNRTKVANKLNITCPMWPSAGPRLQNGDAKNGLRHGQKLKFCPHEIEQSIFNVAQMKFWHLTNLRLQKLVGPFLYSNAAMVLNLPSSTSRTSWSTWLSPASSLSFPSQWHSSSTLRLPCWRDPTPMSLQHLPGRR